ncbi:T9SS type B sorting domain-containing protein [Flaviramulus sp. BrNp1-15]|uniref:T9SS type B sorting domain-containing protein n=1 Tax=Flaviramulus sp. BrNp1-15 TaxID=2916754 RepID=UPI001EE87B5A|nr:T9SS type B sorting domain-containing protein [Flaviramulus sp. BrNp1-15]ULC59707.1 T9SS type B sorting domain-containing protein [Flaviramulus sp. BrNp1-15]
MVNKTSLIVVSFFLIGLNSTAQTFVPDDNFEQTLIDLGYDSGPLDDLVTTTNINSVTDLDVSGKNISDLTGIEDFTSLSILNCSDNQLSGLNISQNTGLTELYVFNNQITNIDVTLLNDLKIFWCYNNLLSILDISQNTDLISLVCNNNNLSDLNTSNNTSLNVLVCSQNQITALDVSNNTTLSRFECGNNLLTNLDVSTNTNLSYLSCEQNDLSSLNLNTNTRLSVLLCFENMIGDLDLSQNSSLTDLNCRDNLLCSLNVNNGNNNNISLMNFDLNADLNCVVVDNANGNHSTWEPVSFSNYVNSQNECSTTVPIDNLDDFVGINYTLPVLNNGNYYTESSGNGTLLNAGTLITTSQTIYIYNETTCDSNETSFNIFINTDDYFIPKYFTPNSDGSHDLWKVIDNANAINNITIYNKYGKLLKFLLPSSPGWDGTFNGKQLESNDYWYVIILNTGEVLKGHFALKR